MTCKKKSDDPVHIHYGAYNRVKFGKHDEQEAISDYSTLKKHLKNPKSRSLLTEVINDEKDHKRVFKKIEKLEKRRK